MRLRFGRHSLAVVLSLGFAGVTFGNAGTQLPLSQYQAGTEQTTLVPNGNFETVNPPDAGAPWTEPTPGMSVGAHVGGTNTNASVFGNFAAQGGSADNAKYTQTLTIDPTQAYVLSGYMWNFGIAGPPPHDDDTSGDLAVIEAIGPTQSLILERTALDGGDAANGYFVYLEIPANTFSSSTISIDVRNDLNATGARPEIVTQYDNVALTPASQFQPPSQVPEPAALSLIGAGALSLLRRRRQPL
jgi:hypothetical protein